MEIKFKTRERIVGIFLVLTLLIVAGSLIVIGRGKAWFSEHATYHLVFDEGYNLRDGANVKILNADVGKVTSIYITPQHKVGVDIEILKQYSNLITRDSVAVVDSPTVIGSEYLSISAGSPSLPLIPDKGIIPTKRKKSLGDYAEEFHLEEKFNALTRILYGVEATVNQIKEPHGPLFGTLSNLKTVTDQIKSGHGIGALLVKDDLYQRVDVQMTHLDSILTNFEKTSQGVEQTAQSLPATTRRIEDIVADIKVVSENIKAASENIKAASKHIESASQDAPVITQSARENLRKLDQILESAKRNPLIRGGIAEKPTAVVQPDIRGAK